MSDLATLYQRNAAFADSFDLGDLTLRPKMSTVVLTCVDPRLNPAAFLGLEPGDALVMRTVGARVTEAALLEVSMLWQLLALALGTEPALALAVIHHTDCGMARFTTPEVAERITALYGTSDVVDTYGIGDPRQAIRDDIARATASPWASAGMTVSGHLYDVKTGRLEQVVAPEMVGG